MSNRWLDMIGTVLGKIQLGIGGPFVKNESNDVASRNAADAAYAAIRASLFKTYGDDFELNSGAAGAGADWKFTMRRPSTGMTHDLVVVFPSADPAPGQALTVASLVGDVITLQWSTIAAGADKLVVDTTTLSFGSTSPLALFTKPANNLVEKVQIIIDTPFNGTPSVSIGITGTASKYMGSTQVDLTAAAGTVFEVVPGLPAAGGSEALIATYSAGGASDGSARILVTYCEPS